MAVNPRYFSNLVILAFMTIIVGARTLNGREFVVTVMDRDPERLALAVAIMGANETILANQDAAAAVAQATGGDGFDVVIDATGNRSSMEDGFLYVAHGGTYVLVSVIRDDITFPDPEFHKREMAVLASRNATFEDFSTVIEAITTKRAPVGSSSLSSTTPASSNPSPKFRNVTPCRSR